MNPTAEYLTSEKRQSKFRWLTLVDRTTFLRAMIVAVVVGSMLTFVNQSGWVAGEKPLQVLQLFLVYLLPFGVVMVSQVVGTRQAHIDAAEYAVHSNPENVIGTIVSHGIPRRAVTIGLFFGTVNAVLTLANTYLSFGDFAAVSVVPLAQAYALPFLFGLLSQTVSYRRVRYQPVTNRSDHVRPAS